MKKEKKNSIGIVAVLLYIAAAAFLAYGLYMVSNSLTYVKYYGPDGVSAGSALQYVVTSSSTYFGFAVLIFAAAHISRLLRKDMNMRREDISEAVAPAAAVITEAVSEEIPGKVREEKEEDITTPLPEDEEVPEGDRDRKDPPVMEEGPVQVEGASEEVTEEEPLPAEDVPPVQGDEISVPEDEEEPEGDRDAGEEPPVPEDEELPEGDRDRDEPAVSEKISSSMIKDIFEKR